MQNLASLFVTIVTLVSTLSPSSNITKVLTYNPLGNANHAVLSETDENETDTNTTESSSPKPAGTSGSIKERLSTEIKNTKELRQKAVEETKQKRLEVETENKTKREEFKTKLQTIKDTKKQEIVSKIDSNISTLNQKWVDKWNEVLTRLSEILTKIDSRTQEAKAAGKDTSQIEASIETAKSAIATAQTAVDAQASKTYVITITTETGLGTDVKTTINSFHNDIKNTRDAVDAARKAVVSVLQTLKTIVGENTNEKQG